MSGYLATAWSDFSVAVVGASAALTGLLFVAMSLHLPQVASSKAHRNRSEATLAALVMLIIVATVGLIPDQSTSLLGLELAVAFAVFLVFYALRSRAYWAGGRLPRSVALRTALGAVITLSGIGCGVLLLIGLGWAVFLVVPMFLGGVVLGVANTWSILMAPEVEGIQAPTERPTSQHLPSGEDPAGS
jgi:modulator of FtsH protease